MPTLPKSIESKIHPISESRIARSYDGCIASLQLALEKAEAGEMKEAQMDAENAVREIRHINDELIYRKGVEYGKGLGKYPTAGSSTLYAPNIQSALERAF